LENTISGNLEIRFDWSDKI